LPTKRFEKARQRREEILDAALEVFSLRGFHRATNQDIARAAGIASAGLIYHYFEDKQDLLKQLLQRLNPALDQLASSAEFATLPLRQGLLSLAREFAGLTRDPKKAATLRLFLSEALQEADTASALYRAGPQRFLQLLGRWLQTHQDSGRLKAYPCDRMALQFLAPLLTSTIFRVVFQEGQPLSEQQIELCVDLFLLGAEP